MIEKIVATLILLGIILLNVGVACVTAGADDAEDTYFKFGVWSLGIGAVLLILPLFIDIWTD